MRSRIYTNRLLILQLAKNLGLIYLPDELVRVKINGQPEKYFFLEKKFDNKFMEVEEKNLLTKEYNTVFRISICR